MNLPLKTLVVLTLCFGVISCSTNTSFLGTELDNTDIAPKFSLLNQMGHATGLSDMRGKVVILTFLYTSCHDTCPLVARKLHQTAELLGKDIDKVELIAVSVDPSRDSVEKAFDYSNTHGMTEIWNFLVGSENELRPVWEYYWAGIVGEHTHIDDAYRASGDGNETTIYGENKISLEGHIISHGTPVILIDTDGIRRVLFSGSTLNPLDLVHDIRLLL